MALPLLRPQPLLHFPIGPALQVLPPDRELPSRSAEDLAADLMLATHRLQRQCVARVSDLVPDFDIGFEEAWEHGDAVAMADLYTRCPVMEGGMQGLLYAFLARELFKPDAQRAFNPSCADAWSKLGWAVEDAHAHFCGDELSDWMALFAPAQDWWDCDLATLHRALTSAPSPFSAGFIAGVVLIRSVLDYEFFSRPTALS